MENIKEKCRKDWNEDDDSKDFIKLPERSLEGKALALISYEDDEFRVSEEAGEFLSSIKERVGVIVVAGKYRTGKSFLLNRIIMNKIGEGFGVGCSRPTPLAPRLNGCIWCILNYLKTKKMLMYLMYTPLFLVLR